jgi:hypothetical protein
MKLATGGRVDLCVPRATRYAAGLRITRVSYSLLLPIAAMAAWTELVVIPVALTVYGIHVAARDSDRIRIHTGRAATVLPRDRWIPYALEMVSWRHGHTVAAANLPGDFVETLVLSPLSWPNAWRPKGLSLGAWQMLSFPFFCLPAWWFVGRGLDGLLGRKRLRWATVLTGAVLSLLFLAALPGFRFGMSPSERADMGWVMWGFGLWGSAFAVLPVAWFLERRTDARLRD